jgi:hypothetical protein
VVLSAYSGSPQHAKPLDSPNPIRVTNNSSAQLGILAPVPQNEVYRSTQPQNEVFMSILPQNGVYKNVQPQNEVFMSIPPQNGLYKNVQPQNEVFMSILPQNEVFMFILPQNGVYKTVQPQNEVLKSVTQLCYNLKIIIDFVLDVQVNTFRFCTWILLRGTEKLGFAFRISMESLQHVSKMYLGERAIASHGMYESLFKLLYMPLPLMPPPPCIMYVKS